MLLSVMEKILIIDFGSQFTQLVARRVRECGVYCEILPYDATDDVIIAFNANAFILSGGPQSVLDSDSPCINPLFLTGDKPVLGICYGMQAMIAHFGGQLKSDKTREYGGTTVYPQTDSPLWNSIQQDSLRVWMSHGDSVVALPEGFNTLGKTQEGVIAAVAHDTLPFYGIQYHPEVQHSDFGTVVLDNFLQIICRLKREWTMPNFIDTEIQKIQKTIGNEGVLLALSGGVDSAVLAALLHRAIGDKLHCVLVDNGLLRQDEAQKIETLFNQQFKLNFTVINVQQPFFDALAGITDPEQKRHRIGHLFIQTFEQHAKKLGTQVQWLAQGTIYPDVVESAKTGKGKAVIKTHHNVGGLPDTLALKLIEPLRELFKDEVRKIGKELGLSDAFINRHPFPGPGLAVRVLGEVTAERAAIARHADDIFLQELYAADAYQQTSQAFAVLLPIKSVGVMGDGRTYENVVALRAVTTDDFMTADWTRLNGDLLARVSSRIINEVNHVNRVVYDISSKPPATIEWE